MKEPKRIIAGDLLQAMERIKSVHFFSDRIEIELAGKHLAILATVLTLKLRVICENGAVSTLMDMSKEYGEGLSMFKESEVMLIIPIPTASRIIFVSGNQFEKFDKK